MDRTAVIQQLHAGLTDADLIALMRQAGQCRAGGALSVTCTLAGYDQDPRGLWDIPEARALCQRLVRLGYVSLLLDVATTVRELPTFNGGATLGAWEVWRIARGECRGDRHEIPVAALMEFIKKTLGYLNTVADDHLSQAP